MEILGDIVGPIGDISDWEAAQDPEPESGFAPEKKSK
jgi:hypothetical protein